ncbi:MAG: hypothetical protein NVS2B4_22120 [Ramlibacter sp.]
MQLPTTFAALVLALSVAGAQATTPTASPDTKPADARPPQQGRMKSCNADAKDKELHGTDRRAFMSDCLKKAA